MNCETARRMMDANDPDLAQHLLSCPSCIIRTNAPYYEAPPGLEQKIRHSLGAEVAAMVQEEQIAAAHREADRPADRPTSPRTQEIRQLPWRWLAMAACLLLCASVAWNIALLRSRVDSRQLLAANVLSAHIRSLAGTHLLDVPSSDHHTVKPWFAGKLDFSPQVKEPEGFPLLGGRLEYFDSRPAAALVYGRRNHTINLFTWPSAEPTAEVTQTRNGYHLHSWWSSGMTFWAVSDLAEAELNQFVSLYRRD